MYSILTIYIYLYVDVSNIINNIGIASYIYYKNVHIIQFSGNLINYILTGNQCEGQIPR